jgi:hypothetical protein
MPIWVIFAALASIAATAALTWVLWRLNLGALREAESAAPTPVADDDDD